MKKKVLMVVLNNLIHDARVLKEAKTLKKSNYKVKIIGIITKSEDKKSFRLDGIDVQLIKIHTKNLLPKNNFGWFIKYLEFAVKLNIKMAKENFNIVHAHNLDALLPVYLLAKLLNKSIIYDSHELFTEMAGKSDNFINKTWFMFEKWVLNRVNQIFTANDSRARIMVQEYGAKRKPITLLNIPEKFIGSKNAEKYWYNKFNIPQNKKIVLYQGSLTRHRDIEILIESTEFFNDNLLLVLIGQLSPAEYKNKISRMVKRHFSDRVKILKQVPFKKLLEITKNAYIGVVIYNKSSRNNYLCAPNKLYEYASVGLPIAGSNLPEVKDVIKKYQFGEIFEKNEPKSIAKAINLIDKEYRKYSDKLKFQKLFKDCNWKLQEKKLISYYKKL